MDVSHEGHFCTAPQSRIKATCELPEEHRPRPLTTVNKALLDEATLALTNLGPDIPSHKIKMATHVLAGAGLLDSVNLNHAQVVQLPTTGALIIQSQPWRGLHLQNPSVGFMEARSLPLSASCLRVYSSRRLDVQSGPQAWPTPNLWGLYALGQEVARADTQIPQCAALDLMDREEGEGPASSIHWGPL